MNENLWRKIGPISGWVAVLIAVVIFFIGRSNQSKSLEVELISRSTLVDENVPRAKQQIEVFYKGRSIPNYVILQCRIVNTGGQPIRRSDYEENLRLKFDGTTEIISIEQKSSEPKDMKIDPYVESQSTIVFPTVLL